MTMKTFNFEEECTNGSVEMVNKVACPDENLKAKKFKTRIFTPSKSVVQGLVENDISFRAFYNLVCSITVCFIGVFFVSYYYDRDMLQRDIDFLEWSFANISLALVIDAILHFVVIFIFYPFVKFCYLKSKDGCMSILFFGTTFIIITMSYFVINHTLDYFSPVLKFAIVCEKLRLIFKMLSFMSVVTEQNKDVMETLNNNQEYSNKPAISDVNGKKWQDNYCAKKFIYFLFAPTLLYRSMYPRSPEINWAQVWKHFYQCLISLYILLVIANHQLLPTSSHLGSRPLTQLELINKIYNIMVISLPVNLFFFYFFFEGYLNLAAELLRFADRGFYQDWWNAKGPDETMRKWNSLIHDFIHEVFYKPIASNYSKTLATVVVFSISSLLHEYVLVLALGVSLTYMWTFVFLLPVSFMSIMSMYKKSLDEEGLRHFSLTFHFVLFMGNILTYTSILFFYSLEFYARKNCSNSEDITWMHKLGLKSFGIECLEIV